MRDYSFGNFISALRERCGLSQYQLGALVGVTDKAVSKWENGEAYPEMSNILALCSIFHCKINDLLSFKESSLLYLHITIHIVENVKI